LYGYTIQSDMCGDGNIMLRPIDLRCI